MNEDTRNTAIEALVEWQTSLSERNNIYIVEDIDEKLTSIGSALDALRGEQVSMLISDTTRALAINALQDRLDDIAMQPEYSNKYPNAGIRYKETEAAIEELEQTDLRGEQGQGMEQPDWSNAPEWANYWTRDISGVTMWWELKPLYDGRMGIWMCEEDGLRARGTDFAVLRSRPVADSKEVT